MIGWFVISFACVSAKKLKPLYGGCDREVYLLQDVLAGSTQYNGASLGLLTLHQVHEVLISVFPDLKQATLGAHVAFFQLIRSVAYGGSTGPVSVYIQWILVAVQTAKQFKMLLMSSCVCVCVLGE